MATRRALVIGGSLGGLLAANLLRNIGWDVDRVRAQRRGPHRPRRRHQHASAAHRYSPPRRHRLRRVRWGSRSIRSSASTRRQDLSRKRQTARTMSSWGRLYRSLRDPLPARKLSPRHVAAARRAGCATASPRSLPTARAQRATCWSAPTACAPPCASSSCRRSQPQLCRLRRLARHAGREATCRPISGAEIFERYTFCLPEGELFLAYPVPGRNNETQAGRARLQHRLVPANRPAIRRWSTSAPTRPAAATAPRSRRR